jgi:hypothetical protein
MTYFLCCDTPISQTQSLSLFVQGQLRSYIALQENLHHVKNLAIRIRFLEDLPKFDTETWEKPESSNSI